MTLDPDLQAIFSAADETIAQLDQLHAADRARRVDLMAQQRAIVARLDQFGPPDEETGIEAPAARRDRDELRRPSAPRSAEEGVQLPQRRTPGGPFGPQVRAKLERIALGLERDV